jgi:hypothetical protein
MLARNISRTSQDSQERTAQDLACNIRLRRVRSRADQLFHVARQEIHFTAPRAPLFEGGSRISALIRSLSAKADQKIGGVDNQPRLASTVIGASHLTEVDGRRP